MIPFFITATGRPYSAIGLPTTKHERMLGASTLSYKIQLDSISIFDFTVDHNVGYFMLSFYNETNKLCNYSILMLIRFKELTGWPIL